MQEEINIEREDVLDLEVDYLSVVADMLNEFGFPIIQKFILFKTEDIGIFIHYKYRIT